MGFVRKWGLTVLLALGTIGVFLFGIRRKFGDGQHKAKVDVVAIQVKGGWGYDIVWNDTLIIHQDIIPDIPGRNAFHSKEDALAVGQIVRDRVATGQFPAVYAQEIRRMHIYIPDSTSSH